MDKNSLAYLKTDAYKYSMAEAGFPLRKETFYFSFRKGGWHFNPYDLHSFVLNLIEQIQENLSLNGGTRSMHPSYPLSYPMEKALLSKDVTIKAVPKNAWFYEREPILSVTGPSFLVSFLEPLILQLHMPIQIATAAKKFYLDTEKFPLPWGEDYPSARFSASCKEEMEMYKQVITSTVRNQALADSVDLKQEEYENFVRGQAQKIKNVVDPSRVFEVGMRAASSPEQHMVALKILKQEEIMSTSNMDAAYLLNMRVVGTMGHEHIQRWGNDLDAYRAMRDMRLGVPSYLLDTFDTITSGIPNATKVMKEQDHICSVRYDSGDKLAQYMYAVGEFKKHGLNPTHILEDGLSDEDVKTFEKLRGVTGLHENKQLYGFGGFFITRGWENPLTRDRVSAVYKLSETSSEPRMKFGNESGIGKQSIPGRPVVWRKMRGDGPLSIIGQDGEETPENYICISVDKQGDEPVEYYYANVNTQVKDSIKNDEKNGYHLSDETKNLISKLERK